MTLVKNSLRPAALGLAIAAASTQAFADTSTRLETVIVTADRFEQNVTDTIAPVTVITREELDERNVQSVTQALSLLPSIALKASGGEGQQTSLFIRGNANNQILVLVDGQRINSATSGGTALNLFPVELIERIEYVRGPGSTMYGADAMGGVIQIITRQPSDEGAGQVTLTVGTQNSQSLNASWASSLSEHTRYSISGSVESTEGFDVLQDSESDDDGYRNTSLQGKLSHTLTDSLTVNLNSAIWVGHTEYDASGNNESAFDNLAHGVDLIHRTDTAETKVSLGISRDKTTNFGNGTTKENGSDYVTENEHASVISRLQLNSSTQLALGLDYDGDDVSESDTNYDVKNRERYGVFAKGTKQLDNLTTEASVRRDSDSQFGYNNTWSLGASYALSETLRLHASHGTAFRAPTYNELYWPGYGNPDLLPEKLRTTDVSLSGGERYPWTISAYYSQATDLISGGANVNQATIKGLEASIDYDYGNTNHSLVVDLMSAERDDNGKALVYRPEASVKLISAYTALDWNLGTELVAQKGVFTNASNSHALPGFAIVNLFAKKEIADDWTLSARVDNLFDRDYYLNYDSYNTNLYNATPFAASISLSHSF